MGAPADAIRELLRALEMLPIAAAPAHVRADLADLRRAYPHDHEFAQAVRAVARHLASLRPGEGSTLDHALDGWWRIKFSSGIDERADLRIIFRPIEDGFELRSFGHRHDPTSIYFRTSARRPRRP